MEHPNSEPGSTKTMVECRRPEAGLPIVVNGEDRTVEIGTTISDLLAQLGVKPDRVAVEMNRSIVHKPEWDGTKLMSGAMLEIVQFVGGG